MYSYAIPTESDSMPFYINGSIMFKTTIPTKFFRALTLKHQNN